MNRQIILFIGILYGRESNFILAGFSASKLKLSIKADVNDSGNFTTTIKDKSDACGLLYCPLESQERRIFDVYISLDKRASVSFRVTQTCTCS